MTTTADTTIRALFLRAGDIFLESTNVSTAVPGSQLTIRGMGFNPASQLAVRFTGPDNFSVEVPITKASLTDLTVTVPPLANPITEVFTSGAVNISVVQNQGTNTTVSNALPGFLIQELPDSTLSSGSVTAGYLRGVLRELNAQRDAIVHTSLDTPQVNRAIAEQIQILTPLADAVEAIVSDPTRSVALGGQDSAVTGTPLGVVPGIAGVAASNNGSKAVIASQVVDSGDRSVQPVPVIDAPTLKLTDRLILGLLNSLASVRNRDATQPIAAVMSQRGSVAASQDSTALVLPDAADMLLLDYTQGTQPEDAAWDAFHSAGRNSEGLLSPEVIEDGSEILSGMYLSAGSGLALAGTVIAQRVGTAQALGFNLIGTGAIVFGIGLDLLIGSLPEDDPLRQQIDASKDAMWQDMLEPADRFRELLEGTIEQTARLTRSFIDAVASHGSVPPTPGVSIFPPAHTITYEDQAEPGVTFTVQLNSRPESLMSINFDTDRDSEGRITEGHTLVFDPETNWFWPQYVTVKGVDDEAVDGDQTYHLIGTPADPSQTGSIPNRLPLLNVDNEPPYLLSIDDHTVSESGGAVRLLVSLDRVNNEPVTFQYTTVDDSAIDGEDYEGVPQKLEKTIEPGSMGTFITIPVINDTRDESPDRESFLVYVFVDQPGVQVIKQTGVGTIVDDDLAGLFPTTFEDPPGILEGDNGQFEQLAFLLNLNVPFDEPVTIRYHTSDGTARAGEDYEGIPASNPQSVTIAARSLEAVIHVTIIGDDRLEGNETFFVHLLGATDDKAMGVIEDNDRGSYIGSATGTKTATETIFNRCTYSHSITGTVKLNLSGAGTAAAPYEGTAIVSGSDTAPKIDGPSWCNANLNDEFGPAIVDVSSPSQTIALSFSGATKNLGASIQFEYVGTMSTDQSKITGEAHVIVTDAGVDLRFSATLNRGSGLRVARAPSPSELNGEVLKAREVRTIAADAAAYWARAGAHPHALRRLHHVDFEISDLPGDYLGWATREVIYLDRDAAGYGWFLGAARSDAKQFRDTWDEAIESEKINVAADRVDLLTVIAHEMSHVLGFDDLDPLINEHNLMSGVLQPGLRRLPSPDDVDAVLSRELA